MLRWASTRTFNSRLPLVSRRWCTQPAQTSKVAKLVMVTKDNKNKFYTMTQTSEEEFEVCWGRVGSPGVITKQPMKKWNQLYAAKTKKGYEDQTHLHEIKVEIVKNAEVEVEDELASGTCTDAQKITYGLLSRLADYAAEHVAQNYKVESAAVSLKQIDQAQKHLDDLAGPLIASLKTAKGDTETQEAIEHIDEVLLKLYAVIPRRMRKVSDYLVKDHDLNFAEELIKQEQDTLDVMRAQVQQQQARGAAATPAPTPDTAVPQPLEKVKKYASLLRSLGIELERVTENEEIEKIKKMMKTDSNSIIHLKGAYKVKNYSTQEVYNRFVDSRPNKKQMLFWHGSRNENWLSILRNGLELRPANAIINGKMFGYGTYFADKFQKSLGYTSLSGSYWARGTSPRSYLALFDVHVGKQLEISKHHHWSSSMDEKQLKKYADYDSVFAQAGNGFLLNNEFIVYNQSQCTIKYLVEIEN